MNKLSQLVILAGLVLVGGCGKTPPGYPGATAVLPSVPVRVQRVETKQWTAVEEVVGTLRAKLHASLEAKTTGRITELPVVLGQKVKAGDLLARLDAPEVQARLDQAEASLRQADQDWKRVSSLFDQQAATRADYDAAEARYRVAQGAVTEAKAMVGYVEVRAPFDGVVARKWVDVGDQAAPGKPLVDIEDPSRLQLEADVPVSIAPMVKQDARMTIRVGQTANESSGTVAEIAPSAEPISRTFRVKLDVPAAPGLMSGQFARLLVPVGDRASMRVPVSAVVQRGQMELVFAVENQRARLHLVRTGRRVNGETEILSGLDSGDAVVVEGATRLVDGQPVEVQ